MCNMTAKRVYAQGRSAVLVGVAAPARHHERYEDISGWRGCKRFRCLFHLRPLRLLSTGNRSIPEDNLDLRADDIRAPGLDQLGGAEARQCGWRIKAPPGFAVSHEHQPLMQEGRGGEGIWRALGGNHDGGVDQTMLHPDPDGLVDTFIYP